MKTVKILTLRCLKKHRELSQILDFSLCKTAGSFYFYILYKPPFLLTYLFIFLSFHWLIFSLAYLYISLSLYWLIFLLAYIFIGLSLYWLIFLLAYIFICLSLYWLIFILAYLFIGLLGYPLIAFVEKKKFHAKVLLLSIIGFCLYFF